VGGAREPAPIVIEGLGGLPSGLRSEAGGATAVVALAARARLYGRGFSSSGAVDAADLLRKTSGPWGPPLLILVAKQDPGLALAGIEGKLACDHRSSVADTANARACPSALSVLKSRASFASMDRGLAENVARCIQITTRAERLPAGFAACTTSK